MSNLSSYLEMAVAIDVLAEGDPDRRKCLARLAEAHSGLAGHHSDDGATDAALPHREAAIALRRRVAEEAPDDLRALRNLSLALDELGRWYEEEGTPARAVAPYAESLELARRIHERWPGGQSRQDLIISLRALADCTPSTQAEPLRAEADAWEAAEATASGK
jgi:hypothetical protein